MYTIFLLFLSLTFGYRSSDGGHLDPNGGRRFAVRGDDGRGIDPNGGRVGGLAGVRIDPEGSHVTSQGGGDKGLGVDPNG